MLSTIAASPTIGHAVPADERSRVQARIENGLLWLLGLSGAVVIVEPSPYDAMFLLILPLFLIGGMRLHLSSLAFIVPLVGFNIGGLLSVLPFFQESRSVFFVVTSIYLAFTSVFFACLMLERPVPRLNALLRGYVWAAVIASFAGLLGYFDVAGLGDVFTLYGRASGTFKDPNVLSVFVILPLVFLAQDLLLRRRNFLLSALQFGVILFGGVFLSFSRGAWAHAAVSLLLMVTLTFVLTPSLNLRRRITVIAALGGIVLIGAVAVAASLEGVREMLETRASLDQSYDLGETGRFGNQLRSISELLERPNGFGPLRFRFYFPEDPHNVYVNAFASYGWTGGISYIVLILLTVVIGWRTVLARLPVQPYAIAIWSVLFVQILQGFQIDTDHWRHWYLMLGLIWGLFALEWRQRRSAPARRRIEAAALLPALTSAAPSA